MKDDNFYYLDYIQVMTLMYSINEIRKENKFFKDPISSNFENYVIDRTSEIVSNSKLKTKITPNGDKYKISKNMLYYLTNLTKVNVLDKETIDKYIPIIKGVEENAINAFEEAAMKK